VGSSEWGLGTPVPSGVQGQSPWPCLPPMSTIDAELPQAPAIPGDRPRVLVVRAPYYRDVANGLRDGAARILDQAGAEHTLLDVAGAYELPQAIRLVLAGAEHYDGYVALGCVVRGETDHYDFICAAAMTGLMQVSLDHALALGTGLLTVDTIAQATARSGPDGHNKGAEAAAACLLQIAAARRHGAASHGH
jgi:6,7-dimethyl-8-ribityllumazine synthase